MEPLWIAIDAREAFKSPTFGKGVWSREVILELAKRNVRITLFTDSDLPEAILACSNVTVCKVASGVLFHVSMVIRLLSRFPYDLYLSPTSYIVPALIGWLRPCAIVVHDLIAFLGASHQKKATWIEHLTLGLASRCSTHVFVISSSTKHDLCSRYSRLNNEKVYCVYAGPGSGRVQRSADTKDILCIAQLCPRKNQLRLIKAYARLPSSLRSQHQLLLVGGRGWHDQEIVTMSQGTEGVVCLGFLPQSECDQLLGTCALFAYPSLYEGFGLPVLQAMQSGIPVLTSNRGSLAEVAGDAACIVDPEDRDSICSGLQLVLSDLGVQQSLSDKGLVQSKRFSWAKTVDLMLDALKISL